MFKRALSDLISLLFPNLCNGCGNYLNQGEITICSKCIFDLPYTDFHLFTENRVAKQLWGRIPLNAAMAMLYFKKAGNVQHLIHNLKYKQRTTIGILMGRMMGERLRLSDHYNSIDLILPVPLHKNKLKSRGYNQSYYIAAGVAEAMQIPFSDRLLLRAVATDTQTHKSRYSRYKNMLDVFTIHNAPEIDQLNILLVDDVLTTGATIEACGIALLKSGAKSISVATLAFTE